MEKDKIRFGIAGVGGVGQRHITGVVKAPNAQLVALCDPRGREALEERYQSTLYEKVDIPDVPMHTDFYELLKDPSLDAVIISSPDATHCEYSIAAMEAGLDVLCEKPLTFTNDEAVQMVAAARKTGRRLFAGQVCRFAPGFEKAKELLDSGVIGEVFCVESQYVHGCHENLAKDDWRRHPPRHATSCGGCHAIDTLRYLVGDPDEVFAFGSRLCRTDWEVEDCSEAVLHFPNGAVGRALTTIGCIAPYSMRTVLYGTAGTITANNTADYVSVYTRDGGEAKYPVEVEAHNMPAEVQAMCEAILFGKPARHEGLEGAKTVFVCNAAIASLKNGEKMHLDFTALENA